jgi:hypothetical protein
MVEQLICNQLVGGSNPLIGSRKFFKEPLELCNAVNEMLAAESFYIVLDTTGWVKPELSPNRCGQVAKWSNATDCKSVGFGLRRFKSFPAHSEWLMVDHNQETESWK